MSYTLTEEQLLIQQTAREFAQEYVVPSVAESDATGVFPGEVIQKMAEHDFLGLYLPGEYGGSEAGYLSYILTVEELAKVSGAVAAILVSHASAAAYAVSRWGSDSQKKNWLTPLAKGDVLGGLADLEPGAALGAGADKLVAVREGDTYLLNGKKTYVANGGAAGVYIVFAVTDPGAGAKGLSAFIVDAKTAGLKVNRLIGKMGLRGCQWAELVFDNVKVSAASLLGGEGAGAAMLAEIQATTGVADGAIVVGIAQAAMEDAAKYSKQRIQFGRPISSFPAIQGMLADMAANIHLTRLAVYHAADLVDKGEPFAVESAIIRLFANRIGKSALIDVIQIEGGYGYSEEMVASRFYRDVQGVILKNSSAEFPEKAIVAEVLA
ncbi:acyl-CoA dehydrogenase family protein [Anaeroselena agilis]|uniref:Acyl-CoA dehydrogenase family protein n=1 Tax=Anaeroselena agilis TaxID=3063788 RepID=A0ABU3P0L8_9FIRM|nr:acyl-CoA dehydrogenase family protein [Selenomonadales bacterium 4137-cl]